MPDNIVTYRVSVTSQRLETPLDNLFSNDRKEVVQFLRKELGWVTGLIAGYILKKTENGRLEILEFNTKHKRAYITITYY